MAIRVELKNGSFTFVPDGSSREVQLEAARKLKAEREDLARLQSQEVSLDGSENKPDRKDKSTTIQEAVSEDIREQLLLDEGRRNKTYTDSEGFLTGGIGHKLSPEERKKYPLGKKIPDEVIERWFEEDLSQAVKQKDSLLTEHGLISIPDNVDSILTNMVFNMGKNGVRQFKEMWRALGNEDYELAAAEMEDSKWFKQVGSRAVRLRDSMLQTEELISSKSSSIGNEERLIGQQDQFEVPTEDLAESLVEQESSFEASERGSESSVFGPVQSDVEETNVAEETPEEPQQAAITDVPEDIVASAFPKQDNPTIVGQSETPPPSLNERIRSTLNQ